MKRAASLPDTNFILRYLLHDIEEQFTEAAKSLAGILIYKGIVNPDCDVLSKALALFAESTLDPVDCIILQMAAVEGHTLRTIDKALLKRIA